MSNVVLRFDMRNPPQRGDSAAEAYRAVLEMTAWADGRGVDVIGLSEHHNTEDGFLPSPLTLASAIAARTEKVLISIGALLVPLYDPVRLAEDIAVLDNLAPGRLTLIAGIGYREAEYRALGIDWSRRGKILEDNIRVMQRAWSGEVFEHRGVEVQVLPRPATRPHPLLAIGGNSAIAARRAARLSLPFFPALDDPQLAETYQAACAEAGFEEGFAILPDYPSTTYLARDVEQGWAEMGEYMLYDAIAYGSWRHPTRRAYAESFAANLTELRDEGKYRVLTPEQAVAVLQAGESLHLAPLVGGAPPGLGWQSLRLFGEEVAPALA